MKFNRFAALAVLLCTFGAASVFGQPTQVGAQVIHPDRFDTGPVMRGIIPAAPTNDHAIERPLRQFRMPGNSQTVADPVIQSAPGTTAAPASVGGGFDGVGQGAYGFSPDAAPPDTNGAVGATQYVQWVNESYAVFDKATHNLVAGPWKGNQLWSGFGGGCQTNNDGDPIVQYDKAANRWVMTQFSVSTTPYLQCVAVSTTADATGSYYRYAYQMPSFNDYPKLGVWPDGYYLSFNMFQGNSFAGGRACALDRNTMLSGGAATAQCFQLSTAYGGLLPSDLDGSTAPPAGSPNFFLAFGSSVLQLWKFHVDWANSANSRFTGPTNIAVASFGEACGGGTCVPQAGTNEKLDSLGDRLMYRLAYRNFGDHESLVANHSVTAGTSTGVRWYEVRSPSATPVLYQQGTYAPDSNYRWMGSVAMDHVGNIAMGYSLSGSSMYPSIAYTGRHAADALGTMGAESILMSGTGSQLPNLSRWGDYSALTIDPVDDCTFWYTNEYLKASGTFNWSTRIGSFKFDTCGTSATPDFTISATPSPATVTAGGTANYTVTIGALNGFTGTVGLSVSGLPSGATATFTPTSVTTSGNSTLAVATSSSVSAGSYPLTITGTSGSTNHTAQVTLVVNAPAASDFTISATPSSQTVTAAGTANYTVTIGALNGFNGTVALSASGLPSGATATFTPTSVAGSGNSALAVATTSGTPAGTYTITVTGTSGTTIHSTTVTLVVNATSSADFTISVAPTSQNVTRGTPANYTVTISPTNQFNGTVSLSASGTPARSSSSFNPTTLPGSGTSKFTITTANNTQKGTFNIMITGTSGSLQHSATVQLSVQ